MKFSGKVWSDHGTTYLITFWVNSGKPRDAAMLISLSATIRENFVFWRNGWTDLHECIAQLLHRSSAMGQYGRPSYSDSWASCQQSSESPQ